MKKKSKVLKGVNAFPIAEEKQTEQTSTIEQPIPQSSTTVPQQEEPQTEPISGSSTQPSPDVPKPKKLSSSDFVMYHLCANPEATEDEIKEALNQAGLKMSESVLKTWRPFMGKIFNKLAELGWQRPQTN